MIESDFFIEPANWDVDRDRIEPVRVEVFINEQGVPEEDEWDAEDRGAQHFLAFDAAGGVIGTARLTPAGQLGRVAVLRPWRGRGVGASLLRSAVEAARLRGLAELRLAAQVQAQDFYARAGFEPYGEIFAEGGIVHRWMRLVLEPPAAAENLRRRRAPAALDGKTIIPFSTAAGYRRELLRLLAAGENRLSIYSHDLEPRISNQQAMVDEVKALATGSTHPEIRILLKDGREAARCGHRLIDLAQRLPSALAFRQPGPDDMDYPSVFAVADRRHLLFRPLAARFEGELRIGHRRDARMLLEYFDRVWEDGRLDPNLRRLDL